MKAVMLSIQPRHCENIGTVIGNKNGKPIYKKTIEVRKKAPKCNTPFKCYIYCTNTRPYLVWGDVFRGNWETEFTHLVGYGRKEAERIWDVFNGRVMGEFVCDKVEQFTVGSLFCDDIEKQACLSHKEMLDYFYKPNELDGKTVKFGYAWHISNLEIYDTPKELGEFKQPCPQKFVHEYDCACGFKECKYKVPDRVPFECAAEITRPPQSWCYVEELSE